MKKTLVLGLSTAIILTTLTGCNFDRPITEAYGSTPPDDINNSSINIENIEESNSIENI